MDVTFLVSKECILYLYSYTITHMITSVVLVVCPQLDAGKQYQYTPPTQPPIRPPYEQACHLRKNNLLSREDAVSSCPSQSEDEAESM